MHPSRPFILRPVATSLLMLVSLIAGAVACYQLSVAALPLVDCPAIQVLTCYPRASPDVMASSVTVPLERQFGQMARLTQQCGFMRTIVLVVMVMFVFVRTLAALVIPSATVPLSLVGTFGVMYLRGDSLNKLRASSPCKILG